LRAARVWAHRDPGYHAAATLEKPGRAAGAPRAVVSFKTLVRWGAVLALVAGVAVVACGNDPYPGHDEEQKVLYLAFSEPPKTLDPQVAYATTDHVVTGPVYDKLLEYHLLERPYRLIPGLARAVPTPEPRPGGHVAYRFELRDDLEFADDPCFAIGGPGRTTRKVVADDVAFALMRIGDPLVDSPVGSTFAHVVGFQEFSTRLAAARKDDAAFAGRRIDEQYRAAGGIAGVRVLDPTRLEIELDEAYPQILFWFAMEFTTPIPWEAIVAYDGREGRELFNEHPVGTGPFRLAVYDKRSRMVLERNPRWYGVRHPEWQAPAAVYPSEGEPDDRERALLDPAYVGKPLPFLERIELRLDKEDVPSFTKFLQGYYDEAGIIEESFDRVVKAGSLSSDMAALGMQLKKTVVPSVFYLGFNMEDAVVGAPAGERGRKLRQAMSLVIDSREFTRVFQNGRGIPAESPIPPGLFGYDAGYANPFRRVDLERARRLLAEAGYANGVDPATGRPLHLTFDTGDTSARSRLRFQFFCDAWTRLGLEVEIAATTYNQFQDKVRRGAYQLFMWGWVADYPDPENFLFLLWSEMARSKNGGPNTANFISAEYDRLFLRMRELPDGEPRTAVIQEMRALLERERPWIELFHQESYALVQGWMHNVKPLGMSFSTFKYQDVDVPLRRARRAEWNRPVYWPLAVLGALAVAIAAWAVVTIRRRRAMGGILDTVPVVATGERP
jgi:ABC-type transport system substrate-binding protein